MEDIAPSLLDKIKTRFSERIAVSPKLRALYKRITDGIATYADAEEYAYLVGDALSQAFGEFITPEALPDGKLYFNIAQRVVRPMLAEDHQVVSDATVLVQKALNDAAGIGIKPQTVPLDEDRVAGIVDKISIAEKFEDVSWLLDAPVKNFSMHVVDETLRANVEFQGRSGLRPKIVRKAHGKRCAWCRNWEGEFDYPDVPQEVYQRHENCRCTVDYDPGDGRRQNVHTKQWTDEIEHAKIEVRKKVGLHSLPEIIAEHPKRLASYTPESLKSKLEAEGFEVKPLKSGGLRNIPFEHGGGYKVNFEDGGLLQYHPDTGRHHKGAYYKISTGKGGTHRYELDGTEKQD